MISLETLTALLRKGKRRSDWSVIERVITRAVVRRGQLGRTDEDTRIGLVVHHDIGRGRGTGEVELAGGLDADPAAIIGEADVRALALIGPAWATPPPAAPARVELVDPALAEITEASAGTALAGLPAAADAEAAIEHVVVRLATGGASGRDLAVRWAETRIAVRAVVEHDGRTIEIAAEARRIADLRLADRVRRAVGELDDRAAAAPVPAGTYSVVLRAAAHTHGGYGLWRAFVDQADAALVREGLSRYRPGSEVAPRASTGDEPLDIVSDGTLPFGLHSAPTGDRGEPVRRFVVIDRGVARGLSLDQREAALAGREPNGGIRNLVITAGKTSADELVATAVGAGPVVVVDRLAWLDLDPRTGTAVARIAAGAIHDSRGRSPIAGGTLRLDAIAALAAARRSRELAGENAVFGPTAVRLDAVAVTP